MPLIECIPNVSEGRDPVVIAACAASIEAGGAALLDVHSDADHNRSVFTFAGPPDAVERSVLGLAGEAVRRIDLRQQSGVHPRMGAIDVIPFVALEESAGAPCLALARAVGRAIGERYEVPVFLYAQAATRPSRQALERVRHGGFEQLAARMAEAGGDPDFGPARPHPSAGATAVGVRGPLVAFNVTLDTDRLEVAREIARAIRERDGGLPAVKALGLPLASRHQVQVSMNLVDYRLTSPQAAFDRIVIEAARRGTRAVASELVGLIPAAALPADPARQLMWPSFSENVILERRLAAHGLRT